VGSDRLRHARRPGAGGDHRGRLAAGLVVDKPVTDTLWLSLQVDNSDDAVTELAKKYAELEHEAKKPVDR